MQDRPNISSGASDITLETALEAALSWWDIVGVDTPAISPAKPRRSAAKTPAAKIKPSKTQSITPQNTPTSTDNNERIKAAQSLATSAKDLAALQKIMAAFDAGTLSDNASQLVFSRGTPGSRLMIIGEAPGREEDNAGKPFIGPAGVLLDHMLAAIGLTEADVYITNIVNWRPPGNRKPSPEEIELCRPFFMRHIELAAPDILLLVGGVSMAALTPLTGIMKNRGQWQDISLNSQIIPALPIYHPAFLLRRPELKKEAWRDLLALHARLSGDIAP